jgi:Uma2 family endonuclease
MNEVHMIELLTDGQPGKKIMQGQSQRHYTLDDYFGIEESSEIKHEFFNGEIFAMSGASRNHNRIARNLLTALSVELKGTTCEPFSTDMRVRTQSGLYTYPDVLVVCGKIEITNDPLETITNPVVLVEVLSDSTRDYDRGEKFTQYRTITTLKEYVLIEQSQPGVEHWHLNADSKWELERHLSLNGVLQLQSVQFNVSLTEVYDHVEFAAS